MARNSLGLGGQVDVRPGIEPALLAVVFALALAWPLRSPLVEHHGEAREGLVVQAIVDRGAWVLPRRNGELPSKPPLFHWLAAVAALLFGFSDAVLRLPSAVAAWAVACATFALGRATGDRRTGWLAVGALLGMVPFTAAAVVARVDMVLTACTTGTLTAFFFWYRGRGPRARALVYLGLAAGVLAKGPIGAVLPVLVIIVFLAVDGGLRHVRDLWSWPLVAMAMLVDLGWYALATAAGGREFLVLHLVRENWARFVGSSAYPRTGRGHTLRMPVLLATQYLPWTLALAWCGLRRIRGIRTDTVDRFLHVWWIVVLGIFTVGAGKRPVYLLPAAPAIALLAGRVLAARAASTPASTAASPRADWRVSWARLVVAIAIFDVGALGVSQLAREMRARRPTLSAFADEVQRLVPGAGPVPTASSIGLHDGMVLAYRLRRAVVAQNGSTPGGAYLVPAAARLGQWCDGAALLAESGDGAGDFALMRAAPPGVGTRVARVCAGSENPAGVGGVAAGGPQEMAGSRSRVLLPLGDPSPPPPL